MQKIKQTLKQKFLTGVIVGVAGFISLINGGCGPSPETRLNIDKRVARTDLGKLELCNCKYVTGFSTDGSLIDGWRTYPLYEEETNLKNLEFMKEMCKQGIMNYGENLKENFREQGEGMYKKLTAPMTNLDYNGNFLFFSKKGYPDRFAVQLNNLTIYEHIKDDNWRYSEGMTKWAREGQNIYAAIDNMKAQEQVRNNQAGRDSRVVDDMTSGFGANMATQGLLKAIADHAR